MQKPKNMNPYEAPVQSSDSDVKRSHRKSYAASAVCMTIAFVVGSPGFALFMSGYGNRMAAGRRYATYDSEVMLLGISLSPTTAYWLLFGLAPLLIFVGFSILLHAWYQPNDNSFGNGKPS